MKRLVLGFNVQEGISSKTGKPYSIGQVHVALPLSSRGGGHGYQGFSYRCDVDVLKPLQHLRPPFTADLDEQDVIAYGKTEREVLAITPLARVADVAEVD